MKIQLLILSGSLLFSAATAQQPECWRLLGGKQAVAQSTTLPAQLQEPKNPSDPREQQVPIKGAHLHMSVATHNFGDVPRKGGDLIKEFAFTNDGTVPLVITRVITSCSCLKASFSKRPVAPGGSDVIRITYEPHKSEPGAFNKVIQIYSNSIDRRDVISVQGNSIDEGMQGKGDKLKVKLKD